MFRFVATLLLVSSFLVVATRILPDVEGLNIGVVLPFIAGHLVAKNLHHILTSILQARQQYFTASFMDSLAAMSEKIGAFCLYLLFGTEYFFVGFMTGQAVVTLICLLMQIPILTQGSLRRFSWSAANPARYRAQYTRVLARDGFQQLDRLLVGALFSLGELAFYHLARQIAVTLKVLVRAFVDPFTVRLANSLSVQEIVRDRRRILLLSAALPVAMALLSPYLIVAVGGDSFSVEAPLLALLSLSYLFYGASEFNLAVLNIRGRGKLRASHELATAAIGIATTYTMASLLGIMGVPAGQFTAFFLLWLNSRGQAGEMLLGRQFTAEPTPGALDGRSANQGGATP